MPSQSDQPQQLKLFPPFEGEAYTMTLGLRREYNQAVAATKKEFQERWLEHYHAYLNTEEWQARSQAVLEREHHVCQLCRGANGPASPAHHIKEAYRYLGAEPLNLLQAVCAVCHMASHDMPTLEDLQAATRIQLG